MLYLFPSSFLQQATPLGVGCLTHPSHLRQCASRGFAALPPSCDANYFGKILILFIANLPIQPAPFILAGFSSEVIIKEGLLNTLVTGPQRPSPTRYHQRCVPEYSLKPFRTYKYRLPDTAIHGTKHLLAHFNTCALFRQFDDRVASNARQRGRGKTAE